MYTEKHIVTHFEVQEMKRKQNIRKLFISPSVLKWHFLLNMAINKLKLTSIAVKQLINMLSYIEV